MNKDVIAAVEAEIAVIENRGVFRSVERAYLILGEEMGELAEAILEVDRKDGPSRGKKIRNVYNEAVQVAAVAAKIADMVKGWTEP
jgi:NTP pyrophosphatase (non-canonical NTP hydrolase)